MNSHAVGTPMCSGRSEGCRAFQVRWFERAMFRLVTFRSPAATALPLNAKPLRRDGLRRRRPPAWVVEALEGVPDDAFDEDNLVVAKLPELALAPVL